MIYEVPVIDPGYVLALVVTAFLIAFLMAFAIGANDVANSFGTSVGSGVLSLRQACAIGVVFEILGAVLIGSKVSDTVRKDIVDVDIYRGSEATFLMGEVSALGGGCLWIMIATFLRIPVSATHSVVGATLGFSIVARGFSGIQWPKIAFLALSWLTSPFLSGLVSCTLFALLRRFVLSKTDIVKPGLQLLPLIYAFTLFINAIATLMNGSSMLGFDKIQWYNSLMLSVGLGVVCGVLVYFWLVPWQRTKLMNAAQQRRLEELVEEQRLALPADSPRHHHKSDLLLHGETDVFDSAESLDYERMLHRLREASTRAEYHRDDVDLILSGNQIANISPHGSVMFDESLRRSSVSSVQDVHRSIIDKYGSGIGNVTTDHRNSSELMTKESKKIIASQRRQNMITSKYRLASMTLVEEDEVVQQQSNSCSSTSTAANAAPAFLTPTTAMQQPHNITIIESTGSRERVLLTPPSPAEKPISALTLTHKQKSNIQHILPTPFVHRADSVESRFSRGNSLDEEERYSSSRDGHEETNDEEESEDDLPNRRVQQQQAGRRVYIVQPDAGDDDEYEDSDDGQRSADYNEPSSSHVRRSSWFLSALSRLTNRKLGNDCNDDEYGVTEAEIREQENRPETKQLFAFVQVLTGAFAAFAHGGNDVSNAIGPLTAIWLVYQEGRISSSASPVWLLFYGGFGIATGLCMMGSNVIATIGKDITPLTPASGFCAELGTALTVLVASKIGIPVSTTHCIVGSVVSIGWFRSRRNVNLHLFRNIFFTWLITLPASMLCASVIMLLLNFASAH